MSLVPFVPLVATLALLVPFVLAAYHGSTDRLLTRGSIRLFGGYVEEFRGEHPARQDALRAAHVPETYREYGSKTCTYAAVLALVGSVVGLYAVWGLLRVLSIEQDVLREALPSALSALASLGGIPQLSLVELTGLLLVSSLTLGVASGLGTYWLRWWYPSYLADNRARRIEATLPATVAFCYALSRSGMEFPDVIRIVADSEDTYGAAAGEFDVAVRDMDSFGTDVITALQTMGRRSASDDFRELAENLVSVLQSGQNLPEFLDRQYRDFRVEAESQQESMLGLLATLAEAYVTVLVAGPLFLITILVVIGFAAGDTVEPLRALIYLILPFGNLAFVVYLSMVTDSIDPGSGAGPDRDRRPLASRPDGTVRRSDGGQPGPAPGIEAGDRQSSGAEAAGRQPPGIEAGDRQTHEIQGDDRATPGIETGDRQTLERLRLYRRLRRLRGWLGRPVAAVLERPARLFLVTVPAALAALLWHLPRAREAGLGAVDDALVLTGIFLLGTFAIAYEAHRLRISAIEAAVPDLLDRLASVNEAGMSVVASIDHVRRSDLGRLDDELDRVWADVRWGLGLETALWRFESRVRTHGVSRVVTLLTRAMAASGNLGTVLRIAARQATADRRLERERKQAMLEYTVVVYVSFLVFLFIVAVLTAYLLPSLPTEAMEGANAGGAGGAFGDISAVDVDAYTTLFYHATIVQGALSGIIAGQLSTGDVRAGAKHATVMIAVGFLLFAFVL